MPPARSAWVPFWTTASGSGHQRRLRLRDVEEYREWYEVDHPCPRHLEGAVYGLPELYAGEVAGAQIVANPGCYPTAAILALAPALSAGLVAPDLIVDAKSGVSGAGRGKFPYSEVNESVSAYSIGGHRHSPEIAQELSAYTGDAEVRLSFTPHLVPMTRGILATCYAPIVDSSTTQGQVIERTAPSTSTPRSSTWWMSLR